MKNVWITSLIIIVLCIAAIVTSYFMGIQTKENIDKLTNSIDEIVNRNDSISYTQITDEQFTSDLLSENAKQYLYDMQEKTVAVAIQKTGTSLTIIPAPDYLSTKVYHYNDNGELIKYISISNTFEGQTAYYFNKGKVFIRNYKIEDDVKEYFEYEDEKNIIERANVLYKMYMVDSKAFSD